MDAQQILKSDLLDIIFQGKNKSYGAYMLRKTYNKRIVIAISMTITLVVLIFGIQNFAKARAPEKVPDQMIVEGNTLHKLKPDPPPPPPPPPAKITPPPPVATVPYTTPKVVNDDEVIKPPPDVQQIEEAQIGIKAEDGAAYKGIIAPPSKEVGTGVATGPVKRKDNSDSVRIIVEKEASFPGGQKAWIKYVRQAIMKELGEFTDRDYGTVLVKFIVSKDGTVSDVNATTMQGTKLAEVAVNAIRKGPKWIPAQQNGSYVNAYRVQPVTLQDPNQ